MLPLHTRADVRGVRGVAIRKVLTAEEARHATFDLERCLLWREADASSHRAAAIGDWGGEISAGELLDPPPTGIVVSRLRHPEVVAPGDVVRLAENSPRVSVALPPRVEQQHVARDRAVQQSLPDVLATAAGCGRQPPRR